jgi:hypothetical protein
MLLSPSEMGAAPSSLFPKTEAFEELPTLLRPIKGTGSLAIHRHIYCPPYFGFLLRKNSLSLEHKSPSSPLLTVRPHLSLRHLERRPMRSCRALLPLQTSTESSRASQQPRAWTPASSCSHRSTVNRMSVTVYNTCTWSTSTLHQHLYLFEKFCSNIW